MPEIKDVLSGHGPVDKIVLKTRIEFLLRVIVDMWRHSAPDTDRHALLRTCSSLATHGSAVIHLNRMPNMLINSADEHARSKVIARIVINTFDQTFRQIVWETAGMPYTMRILKEETRFRECIEKVFTELCDLYDGRKEFPVIEELKAKEYGKINVYCCELGHQTVTVDRQPGVTPFLISCPACKKTGITTEAHSAMYKCDQSLKPTHEFYRPTPAELEEMSKTMSTDEYLDELQHLDKGGLSFREIKEVNND